ncbi:MAG: zinc-binding dehydrogenase [Deltaproteobacteria bacterium]|nr:zinc-binding dehydrogenase [Deltaproteobacteria bacterium]MBW2629712.1 zinc-binding dehydrogenase [Deltaproteobacteria bacterium]
MKAIVQEQYGSLDALEVQEVERPAAGDDEVLVRVRAASAHPDVWHVVCGRPYVLRLMGAGFFKPKNPIPGTDMAGVVEAVGKNVTQFQPGDEVFGETIGSMQWINGGAFAEYVTVAEECLLIPHFFKLMFLSLFVKQLPKPNLSMPSKKDTMAVFREFLEAGRITPVIDRTYPLSKASEAIRYLMEGEPTGRVVITP